MHWSVGWLVGWSVGRSVEPAFGFLAFASGFCISAPAQSPATDAVIYTALFCGVRILHYGAEISTLPAISGP